MVHAQVQLKLDYDVNVNEGVCEMNGAELSILQARLIQHEIYMH